MMPWRAAPVDLWERLGIVAFALANGIPLEREADEDIAAGRVKRFDSVEELFADLDTATPE